MTVAQTWTWDSGLAVWSFTIPPPAPAGGTTADRVRRHAVDVLSCLDGFAVAAEVELVTLAGGELPQTWRMRHPDPAARLMEITSPYTDLLEITLALDLAVVLVPGQAEQLLSGGASVWLSVDRDAMAGPVHLGVSLDVDIHAATTWAPDRDNRALAAVNAPRLATFLRCCRQRLGATLDAVDSESYQAGPCGFDPV